MNVPSLAMRTVVASLAVRRASTSHCRSRGVARAHALCADVATTGGASWGMATERPTTIHGPRRNGGKIVVVLREDVVRDALAGAELEDERMRPGGYEAPGVAVAVAGRIENDRAPRVSMTADHEDAIAVYELRCLDDTIRTVGSEHGASRARVVEFGGDDVLARF